MTEEALQLYRHHQFAHPDVIILVRVCGGYATFNESAEKLRTIRKLRKKKMGDSFYVCFADADLDLYLPKMVRYGFKVAFVGNVSKS